MTWVLILDPPKYYVLRKWIYLSTLIPCAAFECFNLTSSIYLLSFDENKIFYLLLDIIYIVLMLMFTLLLIWHNILCAYFEFRGVSFELKMNECEKLQIIYLFIDARKGNTIYSPPTRLDVYNRRILFDRVNTTCIDSNTYDCAYVYANSIIYFQYVNV